jgi:hypothetical protein
MLVFQQRVVQQQLPPSLRSIPNPTPKRVQGRQGHNAAAAAAAALLFACSVAAAHAAQQVTASYSLGTWSTAALSVARYYLAATSLPNLGVAIFAGGYSTFFMLVFVALREGCFLRGELNCLSGVVCMAHVHLRWQS